jgi:hypothetical protein
MERMAWRSSTKSERVVREGCCRKKQQVTVGEPKSAEIYVSEMPSLKAKKREKLPQEKGKRSQGVKFTTH